MTHEYEGSCIEGIDIFSFNAEIFDGKHLL